MCSSDLNFDSASRGIDGTGKFDQHTVAGGLDDAAAMSGDGGVDKRFSESLQLRQRAFLVGANQAAITGDIRRQDSRQSPLYGLAAQDAPRGLGKLDVHHSSIVGRCPARTNVRFGSRADLALFAAGRGNAIARFGQTYCLVTNPNLMEG